MTEWTQPRLPHLARRLAEIRARLQAVTPQLIEAQVRAVGSMADVVKAATGHSPPESQP
ncbi:MAG: hypothetical protein ABIK09_10190 [Pseudomonadota bacterium]